MPNAHDSHNAALYYLLDFFHSLLKNFALHSQSSILLRDNLITFILTGKWINYFTSWSVICLIFSTLVVFNVSVPQKLILIIITYTLTLFQNAPLWKNSSNSSSLDYYFWLLRLSNFVTYTVLQPLAPWFQSLISLYVSFLFS